MQEESIYIYCEAKQDQLIEGSVCKMKQVIIQHPPFWDYDTWQNNLLGMYVVAHYDNKVCGQSGSIVPRSPGSGILVPCGNGQIFMAAQVWQGMSQALVLGAFFWTAGMAGTAGACFIWVASVVGAADVGCMHGAGGGDAGCAAKKQCLVGAYSVAVVPLGTVLATLTLHSQRCLHTRQYVEPLLVHTW